MMTAIFVMAGLGLFAGICLSLAWRLFYVEEDPALEKICGVLPGVNCGACGYIGCRDAAQAVLNGKASVNVCAAGGYEVAHRLSDLLKIAPPFSGPVSAVSGCRGGGRPEIRFYYNGIKDCRAEQLFYGGGKICEKGCLGHGSCERVCRFNAIRMGGNRRPQIIENRCRGCGKCVEICPAGVLSLTGPGEKLLHLNRTDECLAPCRQKCPAQIDIPRMVKHIRRREYAHALSVIREKNPLPLSVGRVCAHPCENICRRNIADQGVAVSQLGRFLSELPLRSGRHFPDSCLADTGHRVAVVGGGPAGLSCAYFLRRLGHHPVIFEKHRRLGGMLRYGIPEYRLPKRFVDMDVEGILRLGIKAETGMALSRDFTLGELKTLGFEAVFLGLGAWHVPSLCVHGEFLNQVVKSLDFLSWAGSKIKDLSGISAVVIGESNTAMDCARTCIRMNAAGATIICPSEQKAMSARKRDVTRAMEEGVDIIFSASPTRIIPGPDYGQVLVGFCRLAPAEKKGAMGEKISGSEKNIAAGLVISAYERKPDIDFLVTGRPGLYAFRATPKSTLAADKLTLLASKPDVFTAGDMYTGRASVIDAVAGGRMAARSIHFYLTRGEIPVPDHPQMKINPRSIIKEVAVSCHIPKVTVQERDAELRKKCFVEEVLGTISQDQALMEAGRCLQCGTLCNE